MIIQFCMIGQIFCVYIIHLKHIIKRNTDSLHGQSHQKNIRQKTTQTEIKNINAGVRRSRQNHNSLFFKIRLNYKHDTDDRLQC